MDGWGGWGVWMWNMHLTKSGVASELKDADAD